MSTFVRRWPLVVVLALLVLMALACNMAGSGEEETAAAPAAAEDTSAAAAAPATAPQQQAESGGEQGVAPTGQAGQSSGGGQAPLAAVSVQARANEDVNIRERPGEGCPIIGFVPKDMTINLFIRTTDRTQYWYQTDYLGPDQPGWVYHGPLTLLEDDSVLPREPEQGCLYCGDGTCSAALGETCSTCQQDCGACPFCGDGAVNQTSEQCDGGGCASGYSCNSSCQCVRNPYCGDGAVNQTSEQCDGGGCASGYSCNSSCQCVRDPYCGDGVCNDTIGENPCSCPNDCTWGVCIEPLLPLPVLPFCGDGVCNEADPCSCEADCGPC